MYTCRKSEEGLTCPCAILGVAQPNPVCSLRIWGLTGSAQEKLMSLHSIRITLLALASAIILAACGGSSSSTPQPPEGGLIITPGDSQVTISWKQTPGVEYWIFAAPNRPSLNLDNWLESAGSTYRLNVTSPYVVTGLANGTPYSFFMTGRTNKGPGSVGTPTVTSTPRPAGIEWAPGTTVNTGKQVGLSFGSYIDTASNTYKYLYLAVGNGGRMFKAASIDAWTAITPVVTTNLNSATFGFAKYMAAGDAGQIIYSSDTQTWSKANSVTTQNLNAIATNGSLAIAVGNNGTILTSKDGITWTAASSIPTAAHLYGVNYTLLGTWIAVGANGSILTSTDGSTWTAQTSNVTADLKAAGSLVNISISATEYVYVVVGNNGTVLSSTDGITWTARNANTRSNLNDLASINQFTAVGTDGTIISSTDGIAWTSQISNTNTELIKILRAENQLIAVNSSGGIFSSK